MSIVTEPIATRLDAAVGGDTHQDSHTLVMLDPVGATITQLRVSNNAAGYADAVRWIDAHRPGPRVLVGLEGTRSYGIGLARALHEAGQRVVEVERPRREQRRGRGKSDPIDARLAARAVLAMDPERLPTPRADGDREALRILLSTRREQVETQTRHINQLRALLRTGTDHDRALASGALTSSRLQVIAARRGHANDNRVDTVRRAEARRLAQAITQADQQLRDNKNQLRDIVTDLAPALLTTHGIGPVTAAQALVSWSHPGRVRNEAAFAALAGANPVPASSGKTVRHRLNRGGDRHLNAALHTIALTRRRTCPRTIAYVARRRAEGKTDREIQRILKRYIAREIHRRLNATTT